MSPRVRASRKMLRNHAKTVVLASLLALTSCGAFADTPAGEGRLSVSPSVAAALETFQATGLPGFFAVSEDGTKFGFAHCRTDRVCGEEAESLAVRFCQDETEGTCHVLTDKLKTLWPGPVTMPNPDDVALVRAGWHSFLTRLSWPSHAPETSAWSLVPEGEPIGWIKLSRSPGLGSCFGAYAAASESAGSWQLTCGPDQSAAGTYRRESGSWVAEGRSNRGEAVRFIIRFK